MLDVWNDSINSIQWDTHHIIIILCATFGFCLLIACIAAYLPIGCARKRKSPNLRRNETNAQSTNIAASGIGSRSHNYSNSERAVAKNQVSIRRHNRPLSGITSSRTKTYTYNTYNSTSNYNNGNSSYENSYNYDYSSNNNINFSNHENGSDYDSSVSETSSTQI